jgi:hypothetical protein
VQPFKSHILTLSKGRSAYEPPDSWSREQSGAAPNDSAALISHEGNETERIQALSTARPGHQDHDQCRRYIQQYDEHGHPTNPRSRALARLMREAQNNVLAVVGICVRDLPLLSDKAAPAPEDPDSDGAETEDTVGISISILSILARHALTWGSGALIDRILVKLTCTPYVCGMANAR